MTRSPAFPHAKKSLGQHFLRNAAICERIATLLQPTDQDRILEIGPGPGPLTRALEALPHRTLLMIEKDRHWAAERQRMAAAGTQSALMDALRLDWRRIQPDYPWKIIGNLPYNVASALIWDIVSQAAGLTRAVFMVQKEVGQRMAALPGSGEYGALSVWVQSFVAPRLEFVVKPAAFTPPPKVDSTVLAFDPLPLDTWPKRPGALARLLRVCFQQRRKQIGGIFRRAGLPEMLTALEAEGFSPFLRPESLSPADFRKLSLSLPL
ncbi:MAG: 16S rRNA (adenine(1518)-N(6)/adenine(1519)-N(6))-dimethyltransferase RsmA [Desulfovibrio sp.]|nr:16S rRNA (adenine(1518)-N(6)/adenine(1519)-N(6))-dimethyltransferase RsmA [Desulfovibrio sp.]